MKLEQSFAVKAPVARVWETLIDVERVAPCLPGAQVTEVDADGTYHGTFSVKLGPTTAAYNGRLRIESLDEQARVATMQASGTDKRGQGGVKATLVNTLHEEGDGTRVEVVSDFTITGRLARFGRGGMIQDVSNRLLADFAACLRTNLESAETERTSAASGHAAPAPSVASSPAPSPSEAASALPSPPAPPSAPAPPPSGASTKRPLTPTSAKPIGGLRLLLRVLGDRLRRLRGRR